MIDPERIRERINTDPFSVLTGIQITELRDGYAVAETTVSKDTVNTIETAHGALIFAVADEAFAAACNADNVTRVAQQVSITFTRPAGLGEHLRAIATRISQTRKTALYLVEVLNDEEKVVAHCQCLAYSLGMPYIEE